MEALKSAIEHTAIYRCGPDGPFKAIPGKAPNAWYKWQFYLRRVLLNPKLCREAAELIASQLDLSNVQLGACEDAGVPLGFALAEVTGLNLFTIKKTRKAYGLLNFTLRTIGHLAPCNRFVQQQGRLLTPFHLLS